MQIPLFELPSDWRPPLLEDLPSWSGAKRIGIDIETCDPYLRQLGPSVRRGGYIAGISFAIEDGPSFYLPIRHEGGDNLPAETVLAYVRDQAAAYDGIIVGANINYDLDYLAEAGILFPKIKWQRDVQVADSLINELYDSYSLESIAQRWGTPGKDMALLEEAARAYGLKNPRAELYKLPARYVGSYAERDAHLPLQLLRKQERVIDDEDLWQIYNLESEVQPVLLKLRRRGVRIDTKALEGIRQWTLEEETRMLGEIDQLTGVRIGVDEIWQKTPVARALLKSGVTLKQTPSGQPKIDKATLKAIDMPIATLILEIRQMNKLRTTFVKSIEDHMINGRIHCTFNQVRRTKETGDTKGARYGRTSSEDPNLQQQPARGPFAKRWRSIYVPDEEGQEWMCADYSQQEPRMLTHFAELCELEGAAAAAERYRTDPNMDNHQMMADLCGIPRKPAKNIFLGLCYGMGGAKLARELGLPTKRIRARTGHMIEVAGDEAQALLDKFDARVPYVRQLARATERLAQQRGYIKTILGRRCRFPQKLDGSYDWTHKAINRLIQGSSADQTKRAMVEVERAGLPLQLQVHDEIDASINSRAQAEQIAEIMRECVKLNVPSKVDLEIGPSWGEVKEWRP